VALARLLQGWVLVSIWLIVWEIGQSRLLPAASPGPRPGLLRFLLGEALLLTLFAALWFASLGHGGWPLLFLLLGLLMEAPARFRDDVSTGRGQPAVFDLSRTRWVRVGLGVARIVGAGGVLAWGMG
jgi:hypothetical protein